VKLQHPPGIEALSSSP